MAQDYDYGQLLDDFELGADVMPGESLTDYIERRRREFESKADGGSIGIEVLFTDKMKDGGRVPALSGGFLKLLADGAAKGKQGIMEIVESGKGKFDDLVEYMNQSKKPSELIDESIQVTKEMTDGPITVKMLEDMNPDTVKQLLRTEELGLYSKRPEALIAADMIKRFTKADGSIDYKRAEIILNKKLKGNESLDELLEIEFTTRPEKKADGGRVGLFMGGDPLTGQALNIYDSMKSYNFTDQQIADALSAQGLYTAAGSGSATETTAPNIINQQIQTGGGGGGITELQETFRTEPGDPQNFQLSQLEGTTDYFPPTTMMGKAKNFFQKLSTPQVRGTLGTRMANQPRIPIPSFASFLANYSSPFNLQSKNYNPLMESQLNFLETQDGMIGINPNSGLLQYGPESVLAGKNVFSLAGTNDPEQALLDYITKMNANKKISATAKAAKLAQAQKELEELKAKTEAARAAQYGPIDYGRGSDGQRSYDFGQGFGINATTGGPVSNKTGKGRTDYSKGGLATMFTRRR